MKKQDPSWAPQ